MQLAQPMVADGYESVRDQFVTNLDARGDAGAGVCAFVDGRKVVDLWGGRASEDGRQWTQDTLACVYSVSKGLTALCAHLLVDRGELDVEFPVAHYWPEFAQAGKSDVTVAMLLSHEAGLIGPRDLHGTEVAHDWDAACAVLAATRPWWRPGTAQGYHAITFGWLVGEVVRRIAGQSLGSFLRSEVTDPIGADIWIGTPDSEHERIADMMAPVSPRGEPAPPPLTRPIEHLDQHPFAPVVIALRHLPTGAASSPEFRRAEIPATNGHATARGLALVYDAIVRGELLRPETIKHATTTRPMPGGRDLVLGAGNPAAEPSHLWSLGFQVEHRQSAGPSTSAFGHGGVSGAMAFADPIHRIAFAYVPNRFAGPSPDGSRVEHLVRAVYRSAGIVP